MKHTTIIRAMCARMHGDEVADYQYRAYGGEYATGSESEFQSEKDREDDGHTYE